MIDRLKLMSDYHCFPLWVVQEGGNVNPDELPLTNELKSSLHRWAASYDRTLNRDYPPDSGFAGPDEEEAFEAEGLRLWQELQAQLRGTNEVVYYSQLLARVLDKLPTKTEGHQVPTAGNGSSGSVRVKSP